MGDATAPHTTRWWRRRRWLTFLLLPYILAFMAVRKSVLLPESNDDNVAAAASLASAPTNRTVVHYGKSTTVTTAMTTKKRKGLTCYVRRPAWHGHFPHHFEKIVQCWHLVYNASDVNNDDGCVYAFGRRPLSTYGSRIMSLLNFRPVFTKVKPPSDEDTMDVVEIPSGLAEDGFTWFHSVGEASAFRRRVLPDVRSPFEFSMAGENGGGRDGGGERGNETGDGRGNQNQIRIGFIQRRGRRVLTNLEEIRSRAEKDLIHEMDGILSASASNPQSTSRYELVFSPTVYMEDLSLENQATYFATHHVVLKPHGAGTINAWALHPGCVVIETFPTNYALIYYFRGLVEQVGGTYLYWYNGTAVAGLHDVEDGGSESEHRNGGMVDDAVWRRDFDTYVTQFGDLKGKNVTPPVGEVYDLLVVALRRVLEVAADGTWRDG